MIWNTGSVMSCLKMQFIYYIIFSVLGSGRECPELFKNNTEMEINTEQCRRLFTRMKADKKQVTWWTLFSISHAKHSRNMMLRLTGGLWTSVQRLEGVPRTSSSISCQSPPASEGIFSRPSEQWNILSRTWIVLTWPSSTASRSRCCSSSTASKCQL